MKHRKFVKQLMSRGMPRNQANQLAKITQELGCGYFKALGDFLTLCSIRAFNTWEGEAVVWQTAAANCWVGVLANE